MNETPNISNTNLQVGENNPTPPPSQPTKPPSKTRPFVFGIVTALVLQAVAVGVIYTQFPHLLGLAPKSNDSVETPLPLPEVSGEGEQIPLPIVKDGPLVFVKENELWRKNPDGSEKQITSTGKTITAFDYHPATQTVAYLKGRAEFNSANYRMLIPDTAELLSLGDNKATVMLKYPATKRAANEEYENQLRDVGFSPDGSLVAITTSQSVHLFNSEIGKIDKLYEAVPDGSRGMVYAYSRPRISPDNTRMLLNRGYYEGGDFVILAIPSGTLTELKDFQAYIDGKRVVSWLDNNHFLALNVKGSVPNGDLEGTDLLSVDASSLSETLLVTVPNQSIYQAVEYAGTYYLAGQNFTTEKNKDGIEYTRSASHLLTYKTGSMLVPQIIKSWPQGDNGDSTNVISLKISPTGNTVLVELGHSFVGENPYQSLMEYDPSTKKLTELVDKGGFSVGY